MGRESGVETSICTSGKINSRNVIICLKVYSCKTHKKVCFNQDSFAMLTGLITQAQLWDPDADKVRSLLKSI